MEYLHEFSYDDNLDLFIWKGKQRIPSTKLRKWKEIFFLGDKKYHDNFGVYMGKDRKGHYNTEKYSFTGNFLSYEIDPYGANPKRKYVKLKTIQRTVKIKLIDGIKYEELFSEILKKILQSL